MAGVAIATGQRTSDAAALDEPHTIKEATTLPVLVGSGADITNVGDILSLADGAILASSLKRDGTWWNEVDGAWAAPFLAGLGRLR